MKSINKIDKNLIIQFQNLKKIKKRKKKIKKKKKKMNKNKNKNKNKNNNIKNNNKDLFVLLDDIFPLICPR